MALAHPWNFYAGFEVPAYSSIHAVPPFRRGRAFVIIVCCQRMRSKVSWGQEYRPFDGPRYATPCQAKPAVIVRPRRTESLAPEDENLRKQVGGGMLITRTRTENAGEETQIPRQVVWGWTGPMRSSCCIFSPFCQHLGFCVPYLS